MKSLSLLSMRMQRFPNPLSGDKHPTQNFCGRNAQSWREHNSCRSKKFSGDLDELEERVKSMMEKSENKYANGNYLADRCKVCGKEGMGRNIKDHIEANHLDGIVIPCNLCDKTFRSRNGFRQHKRQHNLSETYHKWSFQVQSFFEEPHQTEMFQFLNKSEIFSAHDLHWDNTKQKSTPAPFMIVEKMLPHQYYLWESRKEESWWIRAKSFAKGHLAVELAASITIGTKMPTFGPKRVVSNNSPKSPGYNWQPAPKPNDKREGGWARKSLAIHCHHIQTGAIANLNW